MRLAATGDQDRISTAFGIGNAGKIQPMSDSCEIDGNSGVSLK